MGGPHGPTIAFGPRPSQSNCRTDAASGTRLLGLLSSPQIIHHHLHVQLRSVPAEVEPGSGRNFFFLHEPPINNIEATQTEVIANRWTEVNTSAAVAVRTRTLIAEDVLPMVDFEWADVLPFRVANPAIGASHRDPCALTKSGRAGSCWPVARQRNHELQRRTQRSA